MRINQFHWRPLYNQKLCFRRYLLLCTNIVYISAIIIDAKSSKWLYYFIGFPRIQF